MKPRHISLVWVDFEIHVQKYWGVGTCGYISETVLKRAKSASLSSLARSALEDAIFARFQFGQLIVVDKGCKKNIY